MIAPMTFPWADAVKSWTSWLKTADRPETTIYLRTYHLRRFAADHSQASPWTLDVDDLAAWLGGHDWQRETRRSYRASLRGFYGWAHLTGRLRHNPAALLLAIRPGDPNPRPVPDLIVQAALAIADDCDRMMIRLGAYEGMRRGEIAAVHTDDLQRDLTGWSLRVLGKGQRVRLLPLLDDVAADLLARPTGWVFPGRVNGHLSPSWVGKRLSRLLGDRWTAHTLRHRFGTTAWVESGGDVLVVQQLLGHASPTTTQRYVRVPTSRMRDVVVLASAA